MAEAVLPKGVVVLKAPGLRHEEREVVVHVDDSECAVPDWTKSAEEQFREATAYRLLVTIPGREPERKSAPVTPPGAWEINRAYAALRDAFKESPHAPYRIGRKQDAEGAFIEAAFISPDVGERYTDRLQDVAEEIGWTIRIRPTANQEMIGRVAQQATEENCRLRGSPKLYGAEKRVVVPVVELPEEGEQEEMQERFKEETGYTIEWEATKSEGSTS